MFTQLLDALTAPHGTDRYLELVRPTWSRRDARAEVIAVNRPGTGAVTLRLRPNRSWSGFRAGQFINVGVEIDGVRETRCYSPAGAERATGLIEITVRAHPEGRVSNWLHENARPGLFVELSEADGDFILPQARPDRLLLISGGSGITPVISMLRTLCDENHRGEIAFLHYSPSPAFVTYDEELRKLSWSRPNVRILHSHTRVEGAGDLDGHFTREHLREAIGDHAGAEAYVCGPPGLIEAVRGAYLEDGLEERLHVESFLPPTLAIATDEAEGSVQFAASGASVANSGRTLLEQAEEAGLSPEFGCRMGICHSCTCTKTAGTVRNVITGAVSNAENEDIQICVSVPTGDVQIQDL